MQADKQQGNYYNVFFATARNTQKLDAPAQVLRLAKREKERVTQK